MKTIFRTIICAVFAAFSFNAAAQSVSPDNQVYKEQKECCVGDTLYFYGTRHSSVGLEHTLKYDETAFDVKVSGAYDNPDRSRMPGGDKQHLTYMVICKKQGTFLIRSIDFFRNDIAIKAEYSIVVK